MPTRSAEKSARIFAPRSTSSRCHGNSPPSDRQALISALKRYEFNSWLQEIAGDESSGDTAAELDYRTVWTQADLDALLETLDGASLVAVDTETTSLDAMQAELVGFSFAVEPGHAFYLPVGHDYPAAIISANAYHNWYSSNRCSRTPNGRKSASTSSTT